MLRETAEKKMLHWTPVAYHHAVASGFLIINGFK